jgi:hypothetical protein
MVLRTLRRAPNNGLFTCAADTANRTGSGFPAWPAARDTRGPEHAGKAFGGAAVERAVADAEPTSWRVMFRENDQRSGRVQASSAIARWGLPPGAHAACRRAVLAGAAGVAAENPAGADELGSEMKVRGWGA